MERALLAASLAIVAVAVAAFIGRWGHRRTPTQGTYTVPAQLVREDFDRPDAPWLVAVFTSETCASCREAWNKAIVLATTEVVVQKVELTGSKHLHDRYAIEAVPAILVADADGVVQASFLGPPPAADLWAALAALRVAASG